MQYILEDKTPVLCEDLIAWDKFMSTESRRVKATVTKNGWISTVFLGLDHNLSVEGEPLLFETMIFYGPLNMYMQRCSTWDEAEIQHEVVRRKCLRLKLRRKVRKEIKLQIRGTWCSAF
jgi:hypothetical protein